MDEDKERTIKVISFSGKKEDYMIWRAKFLSYALIKGVKDAMVKPVTEA
jgi:hypothetical protein